MIICRNTQIRKVVCGTIRGCASNKVTTTYINVVCIQVVLLWGSNQECGIN